MPDRETIIKDAEQAIEMLGTIEEPTWECDFIWVSFENALELLKRPTVSGWVSVKDRLPEKKCECLVAINSVGRVWRALDFWEGDGWAITCEEEITHWMPLPEPPEVSE